MTTPNDTTQAWNLCCSETTDVLGAATPEQVAASLAAGPEGHIRIDAEGDVAPEGADPAVWGDLRRVYVEPGSGATALDSYLSTLPGDPEARLLAHVGLYYCDGEATGEAAELVAQGGDVSAEDVLDLIRDDMRAEGTDPDAPEVA